MNMRRMNSAYRYGIIFCAVTLGSSLQDVVNDINAGINAGIAANTLSNVTNTLLGNDQLTNLLQQGLGLLNNTAGNNGLGNLQSQISNLLGSGGNDLGSLVNNVTNALGGLGGGLPNNGVLGNITNGLGNITNLDLGQAANDLLQNSGLEGLNALAQSLGLGNNSSSSGSQNGTAVLNNPKPNTTLNDGKIQLQGEGAVDPFSILSGDSGVNSNLLNQLVGGSPGTTDANTKLLNSLLGGTSGGTDTGKLINLLGSLTTVLNPSSGIGDILNTAGNVQQAVNSIGDLTSGFLNGGGGTPNITDLLGGLGNLPGTPNITNMTNDLLGGLSNLGGLLSTTSSTKAPSGISNTLDEIAATMITDNYLNSAGQNAIRLSGLASKALMYPDLALALEGQMPVVDSTGKLTSSVVMGLSKLGITANTPGELLGAAMGSNGSIPGLTRRLIEVDSEDHLRSSLVKLNQSIQEAIDVHEVPQNQKLIGSKEYNSWLGDMWGKVTGNPPEAGSENSDKWKSDVKEAANELANDLQKMAENLRKSDVAGMLEKWWDKNPGTHTARKLSDHSGNWYQNAYSGCGSACGRSNSRLRGYQPGQLHTRHQAQGYSRNYDSRGGRYGRGQSPRDRYSFMSADPVQEEQPVAGIKFVIPRQQGKNLQQFSNPGSLLENLFNGGYGNGAVGGFPDELNSLLQPLMDTVDALAGPILNPGQFMGTGRNARMGTGRDIPAGGNRITGGNNFVDVPGEIGRMLKATDVEASYSDELLQKLQQMLGGGSLQLNAAGQQEAQNLTTPINSPGSLPPSNGSGNGSQSGIDAMVAAIATASHNDTVQDQLKPQNHNQSGTTGNHTAVNAAAPAVALTDNTHQFNSLPEIQNNQALSGGLASSLVGSQVNNSGVDKVVALLTQGSNVQNFDIGHGLQSQQDGNQSAGNQAAVSALVAALAQGSQGAGSHNVSTTNLQDHPGSPLNSASVDPINFQQANAPHFLGENIAGSLMNTTGLSNLHQPVNGSAESFLPGLGGNGCDQNFIGKAGMLNDLDLRSSINSLSSEKVADLFHFENIASERLPLLDNNTDTRTFVVDSFKNKKYSDGWSKVNLTDLAGLEQLDPNTIQAEIASGKYGTLLGNVILKSVPGLENTTVAQVQKSILVENLDTLLPHLGYYRPTVDTKCDLSQTLQSSGGASTFDIKPQGLTDDIPQNGAASSVLSAVEGTVQQSGLNPGSGAAANLGASLHHNQTANSRRLLWDERIDANQITPSKYGFRNPRGGDYADDFGDELHIMERNQEMPWGGISNARTDNLRGASILRMDPLHASIRQDNWSHGDAGDGVNHVGRQRSNGLADDRDRGPGHALHAQYVPEGLREINVTPEWYSHSKMPISPELAKRSDGRTAMELTKNANESDHVEEDPILKGLRVPGVNAPVPYGPQKFQSVGAAEIGRDQYSISQILGTLGESDLNISNILAELTKSGMDLNKLFADSVETGISLDHILKALSDANVDVKKFLQELGASNVDINRLIRQLANSKMPLDETLKSLTLANLDYNSMFHQLVESGVDVNNVLRKVKGAGIDLETIIEADTLPQLVNSGMLSSAGISAMLGNLDSADSINPHSLLNAGKLGVSLIENLGSIGAQ